MPAGRPFQPSARASPLLGFLEQLAPGMRYAIYPLGRYSRACLKDAGDAALAQRGLALAAFIDDGLAGGTCRDRPILSLRDAATLPIDAVLLLRDTPQRHLAGRFHALRGEGLLRDTALIDQPSPSIEAMAAHLGSYHPACEYAERFVHACRAADRPAGRQSRLVCTLDGEIFPGAGPAAAGAYATVMAELAGLFADLGFSFTLCVQCADSPGGMQATPDSVISAVLDRLGPAAIALHGLDHAMPQEGYAAEWIQRGLDHLERNYGVRPDYWAPPGWTLNWRTLEMLERCTPIRFVRGFWSGVNIRQASGTQTLRFPYAVGGLRQVPFSYVDWMFTDLEGRTLPASPVGELHRRLAAFAAAAPCLMETIAHPFRLVGRDWRDRLAVVRQTLEAYQARGVRLCDVSALHADPEQCAGRGAAPAAESVSQAPSPIPGPPVTSPRAK